MNPEDFGRLQLTGQLERELALQALAEDHILTAADTYDQLIVAFAGPMQRFMDARDACVTTPHRARWSGHLKFGTVRLPGWKSLILIPHHEPILGAFGAKSAYQAARIIVGSCGPRFNRALRLIQAATQHCTRHAAMDALLR